MSSRVEQPRNRKIDGHRQRAKWPFDTMLTAASMVVDKQVSSYEVAAKLGIPYTTVHDWSKRYRAGGVNALHPQRTPVARRVATVRKIDPRRQAVIAVKQSQPDAGSRRIRDVVRRFFGLGTSEATVRRVLKDEGLETRREPKRKPQPKREPRRFERAEPNQLWQSDLFTFLLRRQERVYVAAFMDDHSRYLVSLVMAHHQKSSLVMEALSRAIADYGPPREILTDQGRQYAAWRGSTAFEEELKRNGIAHVKSRPHHPQTCGKIERFWKTMWDEFLSRTVFADFDDCQRRAALFVQHYNFQRPHQSLEGLTPADRFFRSAPQVRGAIEATVAENALRLAREQPVRKPFYLVGRLGDRDLAINATASGVQVRVGEEQTTIPLAKESEDEQATSTTRWSGAFQPQEAASPAATEVGEGLLGAGHDRAAAMPDGALGSLGREAGERGDQGSIDLAAGVLPDGDARTQCDARGARPAIGEAQGTEVASLDGACREASQANSGPGAGPAPQGAAVAAYAQGGASATGSHDAEASALAQTLAPALDFEWQQLLEDVGIDPYGDLPFDPDQDWREHALSWERKLAGAEAPADAARGEVDHDPSSEDVHASPVGAAGAHGALCPRAGGARGQAQRERGGAAPGHIAQSLPDDPAPGDGGARRFDCAPARRAAFAAERRGAVGGRDRAAEARERATAGASRHERPDAASGERAAAGAATSGTPATHTQDGKDR